MYIYIVWNERQIRGSGAVDLHYKWTETAETNNSCLRYDQADKKRFPIAQAFIHYHF